MSPPKAYFLYHGDPGGGDGCADGFTAAWAGWLRWREHGAYLPCAYGEPLPPLPEGALVYLLDISWPRAVLDALLPRTASLLVLDHHATAERELEGASYAWFRQDRSGAALAWDFFHPHEPAPPLVKLVEDRDLWRHQLPYSREINAVIQNTTRGFDEWSALHTRLLPPGSPPAAVLAEGAALLRQQARVVTAMVQHAAWTWVGEHRVPVVNTPAYPSECGHALLQAFPQAPFAATWYARADGSRRWSLRGRPGGFDVGRFAHERYGGGGHPAAAGFTEPERDADRERERLANYVFGGLVQPPVEEVGGTAMLNPSDPEGQRIQGVLPPGGERGRQAHSEGTGVVLPVERGGLEVVGEPTRCRECGALLHWESYARGWSCATHGFLPENNPGLRVTGRQAGEAFGATPRGPEETAP